jgi:raffinose/stachyose/melibiose transport system substrate-binding protein
MKKTKRIMAAVMTAAIAAGCFSTTVFAEGAKITLFQSKTEIMDQLNQMAEDYADETGNEIEVWETTGDNYLSDLKTDFSMKKGPTVFSLQPGGETRQMSDYVTDLSDLDFIDKIKANLADVIDGKTVGIPYTIEGCGLVYNKSMYNPDSISSTSDLINFLKKQKDSGVNGLGLSQEDYFLVGHILNYAFSVQEDPLAYLQDVLAGKERFADNDGFKEWADIMEAIHSNCTNPVDITYDQNCGDFATEKTAMIHQGNWAWSMFNDYDMDFETGLTGVPILGNKKLTVFVPTCWYINADASEEEKQAGKDFLNWLYTSDTGKDYLMNQFGFIPVVDGMENDQLDPLSQAVSDAASDGNVLTSTINQWPSGIISTSLAPIAREFFTSDMGTEEFLNQLNDAFVSQASGTTQTETES